MGFQRRSRMSTFTWTTLSLLISGLCLAVAQSIPETSQSISPRSTVFTEVSDYAYYCTIQFHQNALINNKLYILGGTVAYLTNTTTRTRTSVANTYQRSINIEDAFNPLASDTANFDAMKSYVTTEALPSAMPELSEGYLWVDSAADATYYVGGHTQSSDVVIPNTTLAEDNIVWSYNTSDTSTDISKAWSTFPISPETAVPVRGFQQGGVFIPEIRQGFLLGGMISRESDPDVKLGKDVQQALSGLLTFDADTRTWKNESTPSTISPRRWSRMVSVPYGGKGVLLMLGGYGVSQFPFTSIDVYDIENKAWYTQVTSGAVPDLRQDFCATVVSSSDGLSHQIFMFGGALDGDILSDINVLSIPTFEWFSISSTGFGSPGARQAPSCDLYGKRHLLVFGGMRPDTSCDATGVFLFDMTTLQWATEYPDITVDYEVSSPVKRTIGSGNNTKVEPVNGFANDQLSTLFSRSATATATATGSTTTATGSSSSATPTGGTGSETKKKSSVGAIAGGVLGGLVVVALGLTAVLFLIKRKKKAMKEAAGGDPKEGSSLDNLNNRMQELDPDAARHELDGQRNDGGGYGMNYNPSTGLKPHYQDEPVELRA